MRIKWVILVILIVMILAGTVSAAEMVKRADQSSVAQKEVKVEQAQALVNVPTNYPTIGLGAQYITKSGVQQLKIPVWVNDVKDLTNMDLEVDLTPVDMSDTANIFYPYQNTPSDYGRLRVTNVDKGNLLGKALFDSQVNYSINDIFACIPPGPCYGASTSGQWHSEKVQMSFASSEGISGQGNIAEITFMIDVPPSDLQKYGILAIVTVQNTGDSTGNLIKFTTDADYTNSNGENQFLTYVVMPGTIMKGDGDGDGAVTGKDAAAALQIAVGKQPYNPVYDMNGDGKVDSSDVREILKMSLQSSSIPQEGSQNSQAGTGSSTSQKGLTPETDKGGVSRDERISSIPIQLPKPRPQGAGGKISSIPIQLP